MLSRSGFAAQTLSSTYTFNFASRGDTRLLCYLEGRAMDWRELGPEDVYDEQQIAQRLQQELPAWYLENGWIRRKYKTGGWKGTLMVVNTVGHLAEAAWHHPDLTVSYAFVIVKLTTHSAKGVTNKDFELAKMIEQVVMWQPDSAGGALEGTPDDPRFKYIKYDG